MDVTTPAGDATARTRSGARDGARPGDIRPTPEAPTAPAHPADHRGLVMGLGMAVSVMAAATSAAGLSFWNAGVDGVTATSVRGETVDLVGEGLYAADTLFAAGGQLGADLVILVLGVPLLLVTTAMYRRGSRLGHVMLTGVLGVFVYVFGSVALGTIAYNTLFPVYVATFGAALWAFVLAVASVDLREVPPDSLPARAVVVLMVVSAAALVAIWGTDLAVALVTGGAPARLDVYTTPVTHTLDLAVIAPAAAAAAVLVRRGSPAGHVVAVPVMAVGAALTPLMAAQTAGQLSAGVTFSVPEIVGPLGGFAVVSVASIVVLAAVGRAVSRVPAGRPTPGTA